MNELDQMRMLREQGQPFVTATVVRVEKPTSAKPGAKAIITQDGRLTGWVGGSCAEPTVKREAAKALKEGKPRLVRLCPPEKMGLWAQEGVNEVKLTCMSGGTLEIFLEPFLTQPHLMVVGHQAIVDALVSLGKTLDYSISVIGEGASPERFPGADHVTGELDFEQAEVTPNTYIVVASHGNYDELALQALLPKKPAYIALVASKKRTATVLEYLRDSGMPEELLNTLKYPAGLDFGAITPAEIALSILAEIIQRCRQSAPQAAPQEKAVESGAKSVKDSHVSKETQSLQKQQGEAMLPEETPLLEESKIPVGSKLPEDETPVEKAQPAAEAVLPEDTKLDDETLLPEDDQYAEEEQPTEEPTAAIDPIYGMTVEIATSRYTAVYEGVTYYFCSAHCQREFQKDPGAYLIEPQAPMTD